MPPALDSVLLRRDKLSVTTVRGVKPRRRDFLAVLTGRYKPKVYIQTVLTLAGADKVLKENYTTQVAEQLNSESVFLFDNTVTNTEEDNGASKR